MGEPSHGQLKTCPECGAECWAVAARCWMCHADLRQGTDVVLAKCVSRPPAYAPLETFFACASLLVVVIVVLVGVGVARQSLGLAAVYALFALPALIATIARIKRREARVGRVSWAEKFATLVVSTAAVLGVVVAAVFVVVAALIVALVAMCFGVLPQSH